MANRFEHLMNNRWFYYSLPFIACVLIAPPLPDELGVMLFATRGYATKQVAVLASF